MASTFDTIVRLGVLPTERILFGELVTYYQRPTAAEGTATTTSNLRVRSQHAKDMSPATQRPFQRRWFWIPTASIATPRRGDKITDADSVVWTVQDVERPAGGETQVLAYIGQVNA